ncbi:MAG: nucleoside-diphosphate sugar epimerase/dehydratase [Planctomycetota bacterium]
MIKYYLSRRIIRHSALLLLQAMLLAVCHIAAYWLRLDMSSQAFSHPNLWVNLVWSLLIQLTFIEIFGLCRSRWRYVSVNDLIRLICALSLSFAVIFILRITVSSFTVPRGVIVINYSLAILALAFIRVMARLRHQHSRSARVSGDARRVLIIGAGDTGAAMVRQIATHPETKMEVVAFLDDKPELYGLNINGVPVSGRIDDIRKVVQEVQANEVLISMPNATGAQIRHAIERVVEVGLHARILPSVRQLMHGQVTLESAREVEITDLLGREPVQIDPKVVSELIHGKRVLVTGAGGSIGTELCRQILTFMPAELVLVDQAEPLLFVIEQEMIRLQARQSTTTTTVPQASRLPLAHETSHLSEQAGEASAIRENGRCSTTRQSVRISAYIADVVDQARINEIFGLHQPQIVCHAAAHKHVPLMETNPGEAIKNNVFGTRCLAEAAVAHNVQTFVMVSTDKAINPTSVMGASKRIAEIFVQALARRSQTNFVTVRFGNVLGSSGSVVPIFREQIKNGGPVTVTHPEMRRYFMLIPEAVQLVLQAATFGRGGQIFILDMGEPVRILDIAREMIRLSGLKPDVDIQIKFTGLRPGEKLFEEMQLDGEAIEKTPHERIRVIKALETEWTVLSPSLERLKEAVELGDTAVMRVAMRAIVPEYVL